MNKTKIHYPWLDAMCNFKSLDWRGLALFGMAVANLLFMHYYSLLTLVFENNPGAGYVKNLLGCVIDSAIVLFLWWILTWGRTRVALLLTFLTTAILSFCDVLYSRFFGGYLPKRALTQVGNLADSYVVDSIISGLRLTDAFYILIFVGFIYLYRQWNYKLQGKRLFVSIGILTGGVIVGHLLMMFVLVGAGKNQGMADAYGEMLLNGGESKTKPNLFMFKAGFTRRLILCWEDYVQHNIRLNQSQIAEIERYYKDNSQRTTSRNPIKGRNIIFILVESYLAISSDLFVDGKEITPYLNKLKHDADCYFNGRLSPNTRYGESADGQFIYMTGLLPLLSDITVEYAQHCDMKGLPKLLKEQCGIKETHIIVPTAPTFWLQDRMNLVYGIDKTYSRADIAPTQDVNEAITDEQIFQFAADIDTHTEEPFFSLLLTITMHGPYNHIIDHGFVIEDKQLPQNYKNYLINCHYFDSQLEQYIEALKSAGKYENSLIVITSDHEAHSYALGMSNKISTDLPLYIIHGDIDTDTAWQGKCNQLDVYTTLVDLLGQTNYRGLGHTLLGSTYTNSVTPKAVEISDWIIRGNYWGNNNKLTK